MDDRPAGASAWMPAPFRQDRSPVEKPGRPSRTCRAWMPGKRQAGWPSLLVTFLLATQEKSNSSSAGGRKLFALRPLALQLATTDELRAPRTRCAPTTLRAPGLRHFAINAPPAIPARGPRSPANATARRGGCRSRLRNIPTSPSMLADSRARNLRGFEDIARLPGRRRPSG